MTFAFQDCISTVEAMMREHLDLLFEQHLSRLVACCVYGTTRKHNVVVSIKVGCCRTCTTPPLLVAHTLVIARPNWC